MKRITPLLLLLLSANAWGATYTINPAGTGDFATIQDAIINMVANDELLLEDGIYSGFNNRNILTLGLPIRIASVNGPGNCSIDLQGLFTGFIFFNGEGPDTVLEGITFLFGTGTNGGAISIAGTSPTIRDCVFRFNDSDLGGGIFTTGSSSLIEDCWFDQNTSRDGAGIGLTGGGTVTVRRCRFTDNQGFPRGGGMSIGGSVSANVEDCEFFENDARDGGAIYCQAGSPDITNGLFIRNTAVVNGGAFHFQTSTGSKLSQCTLVGNEAGQFGSGVHIRENSSVTIENTIIVDGGGIADAVHCINNGNVMLTCSNVFNNQGGDYVSCLAGLNGNFGNLSLAAEFCDPGNDDYTLQSTSPCLNAPGCGLLGARPQGCSTTATENVSWSDVKERWR